MTMTRYTKVKAQANQVIIAGIGVGCLLLAYGIFAKSPHFSFLSLMAGASVGGVGYVMRENAKSLRSEDEVYKDKRKELENYLNNAKQRANKTYRLDYFDLDRNKPDFINFNAYQITLSDRVTQATSFSFVEKQKLYKTRTRREVDRVTKKKVYYKEWEETYVDRVIIAVHYSHSVIYARITAAQYNSLVGEYNQLETRRNSVANLEFEYEQLLNQKRQKISKKSNLSNQNLITTSRRTLDKTLPHTPYGCEEISQMVAELCESTYGEPIRLVYWQNSDDNNQFNTLFRERRRGWYIQMLLTENDGQWTSEDRVLPSFLNLLEPDETTWAKLTKNATPEDWCALDEIFFNTLAFPGSKVILAGSDLI